MTYIEMAAWLAGSLLLKGSVIVVAALAITRCARSAAGASLTLGLGTGALGLVVLLSPAFPVLNAGFVTISHGALDGPSIGVVTLSPAVILVAIWAAGALVMLGRFVNDLRAARNLVNRAAATERRAVRLLARAARSIGVSRIPELRETTELATVALIGFRRPILLIPVRSREWTGDELFGVLCHELEHVRRGDWLMLMLERIVAAIYWVNPLVHVLRRQAAALRECAADDAAMRAGVGAAAYAGRLISVARDLERTPQAAVAVAFADGGRVDQRVRALFETRDRKVVAPTTTLRAVLLAIPLVVSLAAVTPWTCLPGNTHSTTSACP